MGKLITISPRDIQIFKLLTRYRYLPSNFILAFVGGNPIRFKQRMSELFHEGYLVRPRQQWQTMNARYRPAIYELDKRAQRALADWSGNSCATLASGGSFAHELLVSLIVAAIELGTIANGRLRFVDWKELARQAPAPTQISSSPFAVPVSIFHQYRAHTFRLKPDGRPFAIVHEAGSGVRRALYFPGIEVDRHTEPLSTLDLERSSILRKILAYREMVAAETYKSHFGFPNMLVPIVTVNETHMHNMMQLVLTLTKGKGASYLLFKTVPDFISVERTIEPDPGFFGEPWLRAGYAPFDIPGELKTA